MSTQRKEHARPKGRILRPDAQADARQLSQLAAKLTSTAREQEQRIVILLRERDHSTEDLRANGIFQPSARIFGLRARGYVIDTRLTTVWDREGFPHPRAAVYHLVSEPAEGGAA